MKSTSLVTGNLEFNKRRCDFDSGIGFLVDCEAIFDFTHVMGKTRIFVSVDDVKDFDSCRNRESAYETQ